MWDDQPMNRKPPPVDMPASCRAFLSPFSRSFTHRALTNDPFTVDQKLTITPLLHGSRLLYIPKTPFAVDSAAERVRHYVTTEGISDHDLRPSPVLSPVEWISDEEESCRVENVGEVLI